jgi:hypothetical protein
MLARLWRPGAHVLSSVPGPAIPTRLEKGVHVTRAAWTYFATDWILRCLGGSCLTTVLRRPLIEPGSGVLKVR